ncbi:MAG: antibiotic biosynthesis monooxygenase [SAR324 cluster bacterium]|nr:antibiotic biosynthesis monooxygenase [SAR324 cluster bacterium]
MVVVLLRFKVRDFAERLALFASCIPLRREAGCLSSRAFRSVDDPDTAVVILAWDELEKYRLFAKTGVAQNPADHPVIVGQPDILVAEECLLSAVIEHTPRAPEEPTHS